jgi:hypothetical protein
MFQRSILIVLIDVSSIPRIHNPIVSKVFSNKDVLNTRRKCAAFLFLFVVQNRDRERGRSICE